MKLKIVFALILCVMFCNIVMAQTPPPTPPIINLYAAGVSYNINGQPSIAGTAMYAHYIVSPGTYTFDVIDVLPNTIKPFSVTSNIGMGLAQKMFSIGRVNIFMPTAAGISWSGANTGWQWTGGVAVTVHLKTGSYLVPTVRFVKSSVSGGSGYQPIIGVAYGWGK